MKALAIVALVALVLDAPTAGLAQRGGGGGGGAGARPAAPVQRSAPAQRPAAPAQRPAPPSGNAGGRPSGGGGFNFNNDFKPPTPPQTGNRPVPPPQVGNRPQPPPQTGNRPQQPPQNGNRPPPQTGYRPPPPPSYRGPPPANYHRTVVVVPGRPVGPAWGWNRGVVWAPAPYYWGGGFWGPFAVGVASVAIMGSIVAANNQTYVSYQAQPDSPGAQVLAAYQLQQVPCGPPDLVVIYGPDNSVICANPNNLVAPGVYDLDPSTLTITSAPP